MSWLSDLTSNGIGNLSTFYRNNYSFAAEFIKKITGMKSTPASDIANFIDSEVTQKADLRSAEVLTFLSGVPYVGDFINGINGVQQLEDLYNKTGKIPAYPGGSSNGASGIAQGLGDLAKGFTRKIEDGTNSLHEFYSGEKEIPLFSTNDRRAISGNYPERMYLKMSNGWNKR